MTMAMATTAGWLRDLRALLAGAALGVACLVLSGASAQISPGDIGGSHSVVAACDESIGVTWAADASGPAFSGSPAVADSAWEVSVLRLTDVDAACNGKPYEVTLADADDSQLAVASGTLSVVAGGADVPLTPVDAALVGRTVIAVLG